MPRAVPEQQLDIVLKFGGGLHTRAGEDTIDETECVAGENFRLDLENNDFRRREAFDLVGMAPNGGRINGFAQLIKADGTKSTLVQSGTKVYEWDGTENGFTDTGVTVNASARLRGNPFTQYWALDDLVIITDLGLVEGVKTWDGTTLSNMTHNLGGTFIAKYGFVSNERAFFANVISNSTATPHMIVGSTRSDNEVLSVSDRPSSALSAEDPFFLLSPDLKPINGLVEAFGFTTFSTEDGSIFNLSGGDATDFAIGELYPGSAASGDESMAFVGDDIWYGRRGRIESLRATNAYGDVEPYDPSVPIQDQIVGKSGWVVLFNSQLQRVYVMHDDQGELYAYYKPMRESGKSGWIKYTTNHSSGFNWTAQMPMLSPAQTDDSEGVYFGDATGNIYLLEGSGTAGDGGTADITASRTSKLYSMPLDAGSYQIEGWLKYHKSEAATVDITFLHSGEQVFDAPISIDIAAPSGAAHFGGTNYFGGEVFFGVLGEDRVTREVFAAPSGSNEIQIKTEISGTSTFRINDVGIRFVASSS